MKKLLSIILAVMLIILTVVSVGAAKIPENSITPLWEKIVEISSSIGFSGSSGEATASVRGKLGTTLVAGVLTVYKQDSNGGWSSVGSNSRTSASSSLSLSVNFTGVSGGYYKSVLTTTVYVNGVGETETATTYKTCP